MLLCRFDTAEPRTDENLGLHPLSNEGFALGPRRLTRPPRDLGRGPHANHHRSEAEQAAPFTRPLASDLHESSTVRTQRASHLTFNRVQPTRAPDDPTAIVAGPRYRERLGTAIRRGLRSVVDIFDLIKDADDLLHERGSLPIQPRRQ